VLRPARIGVVDFKVLAEQYEKMKDTEKELKATEERLNAEAKQKSDEVQKLQAKLAMHQQGSEPYRQTEDEIRTRVAEFETWRKVETGKVVDRHLALIRQIYADIEKASGEYGKANSLSLIIKVDRLDEIPQSPREFNVRVVMKKVLYYSSEVDITSDLLGQLNAMYARQKAALKP
jgi:Skp family chaperone for outer membrane proteins